MKFIISILLTGLLSFACGIFLPWWSIAIAAFIVALLLWQSPLMSFLSVFLGITLHWGILAWVINSANQSLLAEKMVRLLGIGESSFLLILITAFIGGLVGGMAALTASFFTGYNKLKDS